jgi:hypothetical protein
LEGYAESARSRQRGICPLATQGCRRTNLAAFQLDAKAFGKFGPRRKITAEKMEKENPLRRGQCLILHSASGGSPDSHRASLQMVALTLRQNSRTRFENIEEQRQWPVS